MKKDDYVLWLEEKLEAERKLSWLLRHAVNRYNALVETTTQNTFVMMQANDILTELKEAENECRKNSDTEQVG